MPDFSTHLHPILTSKWLPYTLAASFLLYTLLPTNTHPHHRKILKGLSHAHSHPSSTRTTQLSKTAKELYPEYFHGDGHHVHLPMGDVKYWILGPESGTKVRLDYYHEWKG